ncbi:MAG: hypothetical protein JRI53_01855 [Deltaproteobacteria bacterium]|nr:hypothetical protein [Deltaproteobacteria bacterium]
MKKNFTLYGKMRCRSIIFREGGESVEKYEHTISLDPIQYTGPLFRNDVNGQPLAKGGFHVDFQQFSNRFGYGDGRAPSPYQFA